MNSLIVVVVLVLLMIVVIGISKSENFQIPLRESSAWDWNLGPGYGAGYGTGYAMWGKWPSNIPDEPWENWMWGRRPLIFKTPFTPVPQIDYNNTPTMISKPKSNYNITLLPTKYGIKFAIDGFPRKTLQFDRNRPYYLHVWTPNSPFIIHDGKGRVLVNATDVGLITVIFDNNDPDMLYYGNDEMGGVIYLNPI